MPNDTDLRAAIQSERQKRGLTDEDEDILVSIPGDENWERLVADKWMLGDRTKAVVALSIYTGGWFYFNFDEAISTIGGYLGQFEADRTAAIHHTMSFGETNDGKCIDCGSQVALVVLSDYAQVDQEPFKSGQMAAEVNEQVPDDVEIHDEISGHFCFECYQLTSLSFNANRKRKS